MSIESWRRGSGGRRGRGRGVKGAEVKERVGQRKGRATRYLLYAPTSADIDTDTDTVAARVRWRCELRVVRVF